MGGGEGGQVTDFASIEHRAEGLFVERPKRSCSGRGNGAVTGGGFFAREEPTSRTVIGWVILFMGAPMRIEAGDTKCAGS